MLVKLNQQQVDELFKPNTGSGGFQSLIKSLQKSFNPTTLELTLNKDLLEKILKYAFEYDNGGWQDRLTGIFEL